MRAIPSPFGLIWLMRTSYSLPTITGQLPLPPLFLAFLGLLFLGLIGFSLPLFYALTVILNLSLSLSFTHKIGCYVQIYCQILRKFQRSAQKKKGYLRFLYIVVVSFTALTSSNPALISLPSSSIEWHTLSPFVIEGV